LPPIGNFFEYAGCRTNRAAAEFVCLLLFTATFVIFLREGHLEGEGVGTVFVILTVLMSVIVTVLLFVVFEKLHPRKTDSGFK
jgi:hypothetical protein